MKTYWLVAALLIGLPSLTYARSVVADSIGVEKKGGKRFILHRVDEGQTLFSIARRYGTSVASLKAANPDVGDAVRYAQVVRVPARDAAADRKQEKALEKAARKEEKAQQREAKAAQKATEKSAEKAVTEQSAGKAVASKPASTRTLTKPVDDGGRSGIHVVETGQTVYSLAMRYGVSQADLRRWNGLSADNVLIGQALIVSERAYLARVPDKPLPTPPAKTADAPARTVATKSESKPEPKESKPEPARPERPVIKRPERPEPATPSVAENRSNETPRPETSNPDAPRAETPPSTTPVRLPEGDILEPPRAGNDAPLPTVGRRIAQSGVAEMIDGTDGSGKYLALHRTAPIGTLVLVRNEFNNQLVWVKVIGRLPNTGVNDKILIKLSQQAFAKLSPEDRRFRAEVSYIVK